MKVARSRPLIVFDGDDTLWWSEELYDAARQRARDIVESAGLDGSAWERLERELDVRNVASLGLRAERFPTSCREAYRQLCGSVGSLPDDTVSSLVYDAAASVFSAKARCVPKVDRVLETLGRIADLALLTKGDEGVQRKRIEDSGLGDYFARIEIVNEKSRETFESLLGSFSADPAAAWSVGNSVKSDIIPALQAGMFAAWIDAHVWEHERRDGTFTHPRCFVLTTLDDVPRLIEAVCRSPELLHTRR